jgi:hypothetical protein
VELTMLVVAEDLILDWSVFCLRGFNFREKVEEKK